MNKGKTINLTAFLLAGCLGIPSIPAYAFDIFTGNLQSGFTGGDAFSLPEKNWMFGFSDTPDIKAKADDAQSSFNASYEFGETPKSHGFNISYKKTTSEKSLDLIPAPEGAFKRRSELDLGFQAVEHFLLKNFTFTPMAGFTFSFMHEGSAADKNETSSFKPMLGFNLSAPVNLENGMTLMPEFYGVYRYEIMDALSDDPTPDATNAKSTPLSHHGIELGTALGFNLAEGLSGKVQFDSDLQPRQPEFRALFRIGAVW